MFRLVFVVHVSGLVNGASVEVIGQTNILWLGGTPYWQECVFYLFFMNPICLKKSYNMNSEAVRYAVRPMFRHYVK